jgi:hypothetical protein
MYAVRALMLRARGKAIGTWTIAAVLLTTLVGFVLPAAFAVHTPTMKAPAPGPLAPTGHLAPAARPVAASHPLAGPSGPVNASATITSSYTGSQDVPVEVDWTITVTNTTLDAANVSMSLLVMNGANEIANMSEAVMDGVGTYTAMVDYAALTSENYNGGVLPTTPYTFTVWVTAMNATNDSVAPVTVGSNSVSATLKIANVGVLLTNNVPLYSGFPFWVNFTTTYAGNTGTVINGLNATISVEVRQVTAGCNSVFGYGSPCPSIANNSVDFNSSHAYHLSVDSSWFLSGTYANGALPLGEYQVIAWNTLSNVTNGAQEARSVAAAAYVYIVVDPNAVTWLSPSPIDPATVGNVTIALQYTADYLSDAELTVYAGGSGSGTVVFSSGVFQAAEAFHVSSAVWQATEGGEYTAVVSIATAAGAAAGQQNFSMTFNVSATPSVTGGGTVFDNTTTWVNTTTPVGQLIGGLSTGVAAAILLVVGLVVGMVVAMLLGRMMWAGQKPAPAQPWQAKPGTNECSVCHQTFPTEQELKDHQKQAHGM